MGRGRREYSILFNSLGAPQRQAYRRLLSHYYDEIRASANPQNQSRRAFIFARVLIPSRPEFNHI